MKTLRFKTILAAVIAMLAGIATLPAKDTIADRILGYWAIDGESMLQAMLAEFGGDDEAGRKEAEAAMREMVEEMEQKMVIEFLKGGIARVHSEDDEPDGKYKIIDPKEDSGEFTMEVAPPDEEAKSGPATLKGDKLTIEIEGQKISFNRLDKAEAKKRIDAINAEAGGDADKAAPAEEEAE